MNQLIRAYLKCIFSVFFEIRCTLLNHYIFTIKKQCAMRNFIFIFFLICVNHLAAQTIVQTEETKVSPDQIVDFKYTDCDQFSETTRQVDGFPNLLQLSEPLKHLSPHSFLPMSIYYAPAPKGEIYKFRHGFVRGSNHLSIPLPEPGIYFVRVQSRYPTLLVIDTQTLTLRIRCYEGCRPNR